MENLALAFIQPAFELDQDVELHMLKCVRLLVWSASLAAIPAGLHGQAYRVVSVVDGGKITGTVKWSGPMPHIPSLPITKDPQICDPASTKTRDLERLIVGPQGGVANTVVFLKNISSGKPMDLPQQRRFLNQKQCRYQPHILLVPVSAVLQMKSSDATLHTIHMDGAATYNQRDVGRRYKTRTDQESRSVVVRSLL